MAVKVPKKAGAVGAMSKKEARKLWKKLEIEKKYEDRKLDIQKEGTSYADDRDVPDPELSEIKDEWRKLLSELKVKFPEHLADKFDLRPKQKAAALAAMLGWSQAKIAKASGVSTRTLYTWFKDPLIIEFQKAFEYYTGSRDGKDMLDREIYPSIQILKELRDNDATPASTRRDIAIWFFEQKYGKAKETKEIKGHNIKDLTKRLMDISQSPDEEEVEDLPPVEDLN